MTNLAIKGIIAIKAMSEISQAYSEANDSQQFAVGWTRVTAIHFISLTCGAEYGGGVCQYMAVTCSDICKWTV